MSYNRRSDSGRARSNSSAPYFHQQIACQAMWAPNTIAIRSGSECVTMGVLDRASNGLAHLLCARGIGIGDVVGLALPRSPELIVSILACAKSGAAFLLLDPSIIPSARQEVLLDAVRSPVAITTPLIGRRFQGHRLQIHINGVPAVSDLREDMPAVALSPRDLAYVIFTSGSTGRPKGVQIEHGALSNYLDWARASYLVPDAGGAPLFTSVGFDLTITSLLVPLMGGQPITVVPDDADFDETADILARYRPFSFIKGTPTHFSILGSLLGDKKRGIAQRFVVGGERFRAAAVAAWVEANPGSHAINEYGPTEGTVANVAFRVEGHSMLREQMPIGRPIPGTAAHVLNSELCEVGNGERGELYIGGDCLARGYLDDPGRTALSFLPDPFARGKRLYRTGDLARLTPDGDIVCLGRADHQLKRNGHRIEPEEIEAAIERFEGVSECAVALRPCESIRPRLVAFLVSNDGASLPTITELRAALAEKLPAYMIPTEVRIVETLPKASSGKLERGALPD